MIDDFSLGRLLYEARVREAWSKQADARLAEKPYPRHRADESTQTAEADLAMAQARAILRRFALTEINQ
jgi:hypothetical protein